MAAHYVWSGATGTGDGSSWANAYTGLLAAITAGAAGDTYYVANDHTETGGTNVNVTYQFKGTSPQNVAPTFDKVLCVNRAGSVPPVAADLTAGAVIQVLGTTVGVQFNLAGNIYCYGVTFKVGSTGVQLGSYFQIGNGGYDIQKWEQCTFVFSETGNSTSLARVGVASTNITLLNCNWTFNGQAQEIVLQGQRLVIDGPATTPMVTSFPAGFYNAIFGSNSNDTIRSPIIRNCDLSNVPSGAFIHIGNDNSNAGSIKLINCKLPTADRVYGITANLTTTLEWFDVLGCNSAGGNVERNERYSPNCYLTTETTIVRSSGASDGTTSYSWKLAPQNSMNSFDACFETFEGAVWNDTTGSSKTLTLHCLTDNITLQNNELWLEVDYLGDSNEPLATRITTAPATVLTASNALPADTATWTTTGLTTPVKQQLQVTFTPQMRGLIRWRVKYAKSGNNTNICYVCPKADLS